MQDLPRLRNLAFAQQVVEFRVEGPFRSGVKLDHVQCRHVQGVPPERTIVLNIHGFQRHLQLVAALQVVAGDDVGHPHLASRLLQVHCGPVVLVGGGKRADRQRRHVTQRGGNLVG